MLKDLISNLMNSMPYRFFFYLPENRDGFTTQYWNTMPIRPSLASPLEQGE